MVTYPIKCLPHRGRPHARAEQQVVGPERDADHAKMSRVRHIIFDEVYADFSRALTAGSQFGRAVARIEFVIAGNRGDLDRLRNGGA